MKPPTYISTQENMDINKLKAVVCYIYQYAHRNITAYQLAKTLYLTDYLSLKIHEVPILDLEFVYYNYGPYPIKALKAIDKEKFLKNEFRTSSRGYPTCLKHPNQYYGPDIDPAEKQIILLATRFVKEKSAKSTRELNEYIYATEPMRGAMKGTVLNMEVAKARKTIDQIKKQIAQKALSYESEFPKELFEEERHFLRQTEKLLIEDRP